jgi:hypothetical protein
MDWDRAGMYAMSSENRMKHINLDEQDTSVRQFLESLAGASEDAEVESNGRILLRISPPNLLSSDEKQSLIERRRELMRRARDRTRDMTQDELARFVQDAVDEVRAP